MLEGPLLWETGDGQQAFESVSITIVSQESVGFVSTVCYCI